MTAARLVDELTRYALARHAIGVIGDEQRLAYNRVLLSSVLAGETAPEDIKLKPMSWWRDRGQPMTAPPPLTHCRPSAVQLASIAIGSCHLHQSSPDLTPGGRQL